MEEKITWKIVLMDDEADIRDVVSIVLEDAGFQVSTAENGAAGLLLCRSVRPQIVITDIRMPGMDGIAVLKALKAEYEDIEVIVITAFGEMSLAVNALQLDASDFITKPIDEANLLVALNRAKQRYAARKAVKDYTRFLEEEKAKTAAELIKTYNLQKNLIENSMDGIVACDETGSVIIFNKGMEHLLGYNKTDILNRFSFSELFSDDLDKTLLETLSGSAYGGKDRLFLYETRLTDNSGGKVPVQVSAAVLREKGERNGWVCFFRDLRRIRKLERELADQASILHQDKMMSLGRLSASVVHEINNPLFGVLNYVRLMLKITERGDLSGESVEKFTRYLTLVEKETERCSDIISSLLTFSRKSEPTFDQVDIDDLIKKCILLSRHKLELAAIDLALDIDPCLPLVHGDANQLQQCLINLIFNAADAMPDGGTLTLGARHDSANNRLVITVSDTGTGIKKEDLPHIFEPFFTTKMEGFGVGLGLSTVFGIIERHHGKVLVDSRPGNTVFMIRLPA